LNSEKNLFADALNVWQNYNRACMAVYREFMNGYMDFTKNWLHLGTTQVPQLYAAFGMASMVKGVEIVGANITGDRQITLYLRYVGKEITPSLNIQAGAIRFSFDIDYAPLLFKITYKPPRVLSGSSKVNTEWKSPLEAVVKLTGDNTTLNDANIIGISVHQ
jgi:hypothetical protein